MKLKNILQKLEKKRVITRKPKPIYPFLLALVAFAIWFHSPVSLIKNLSWMLAVFAFVFAILHWLVVMVLEN